MRTLTTSVFTTWLNRGSLEGAAQIAMLMLVAVFALVMTEQWARRNQRYHPARGTQIRARPARVRLTGWRAGLAIMFVLVPFVSGFGVPVYVFADYASRAHATALRACADECPGKQPAHRVLGLRTGDRCRARAAQRRACRP